MGERKNYKTIKKEKSKKAENELFPVVTFIAHYIEISIAQKLMKAMMITKLNMNEMYMSQASLPCLWCIRVGIVKMHPVPIPTIGRQASAISGSVVKPVSASN
ncbi:hypothetical protein AVEN_265720-1 [Araneus ventricosus]|uniref:Uncharacterized protein n=1 Tax=Araneus ventricosus TaxID=182803 RepID=A0A4Y2FLW0_ARAVE|nr:hypothetical protein AVEN_265720-1 [Araneus ventricosus]